MLPSFIEILRPYATLDGSSFKKCVPTDVLAAELLPSILRQGLSSGLVYLNFPAKTAYEFLISPMCVTYFASPNS